MDRLNSAKGKWTVFLSLFLPLILTATMYWMETLTTPRPMQVTDLPGTKRDRLLNTTRLMQQQRAQSGSSGPPLRESTPGSQKNESSPSGSDRTTEKNISISGGLENTFVFSKQSLKNATLDGDAKQSEDGNRTLSIVINNGEMVAENIDAENGTGGAEKDDYVDVPPPIKDLSGYVSVINSKNQMHMKCPKCAYVSSSGQLRGTGAGGLIDSFPCVIRMNDAPTRGFEDDVGNKTTIRVIAFSSMGFVNPKKDTLFKGSGKASFMLLWAPGREMDAKKSNSAFSVAKRLSRDMAEEGLQVFVVSPEQYDVAHHLYDEETQINTKRTNSWLSTGWFTMLFAREACDEIHVFGMVPQDHCKKYVNSKVPYHYYQPTGIYECSEYKKGDRLNVGGHHLNMEKTVFARWAKLVPNIFFNYPDWSARN